MKTRDNHIDSEVARTMQSLDNTTGAAPRPFFYTRLSARMEASFAVATPAFGLKTAYQRITVGVVVMLLAINIFTVTLILGTTAPTATETTTETSFMDQYYPSLTTIDNLQQNLNQ